MCEDEREREGRGWMLRSRKTVILGALGLRLCVCFYDCVPMQDMCTRVPTAEIANCECLCLCACVCACVKERKKERKKEGEM